MLIEKEKNLEILNKDEENQSPIAHGKPTILTWTNTFHCNAQCPMCYLSRRNEIPNFYPTLPFKKLKEIAPLFFPYLDKLNLTRRGEPFVDPYFWDIIKLVAKYQAKVDINTNGLLLTYKHSELLIPHLFDIKVFYADTAGVATYKFKKRKSLKYLKIGEIYDMIRRR